MPINGSPGGGGAAARALPVVSSDSFIYWDMRTTTTGKLTPGQAAVNIKNLGHGGALTLDRSSGSGGPIAVAGPTGGGVDFGSTSNLATTLTTAPLGTDAVVMSVACRFRPGYGAGSSILFTKAYPAVGAGWGAPFNAYGPSLHSPLDGTVDWNVNVGGVDLGVTLGGRFALAPDTDYWLDLRKRPDGTADIFIQGTKVSHITPGALTDWGLGEWMLGGNIHNTGDAINGAIFFAELRIADLTDDQILTRARGWLGWSS